MSTMDFLEDVVLFEDVEETLEERSARLEREAEVKREQDARMRAISAVYETADRIITGDPLIVRLQEQKGAPSAWSDGKSITLNAAVLKNYDDDDIISLHGVNYHEVCHILYSPREGSEIMKWAVEGDFMQAFNVLEDQRIETLFAARFPSTRSFLQASTLRYVLELSDYNGEYPAINKHAIEMAFILTHGRRFLDSRLRQMLREAFEARYGKVHTDTVAEIVDEYRLLTFPQDYTKAKELIANLKAIMDDRSMMPMGPCVQRDPMQKGRPDAGSAQSKDVERAKAEDGKPSNDDDSEASPDAPDSGTHGKDQEGKRGEDKDWTREERLDALKRELSERVNDLLEKVSKDKSVIAETREFRQAVRLNERSMNSLRRHTSSDYSVEPDVMAAARSFGDALRELQQEADPAWLYEKPHGKLNVQRAMNADVRDFDKLFDQWYEGDDVCDIEAAVLLDCSGSMQHRMSDANAATWSIKRGLERIGSRVTVYTFNEFSRLLYSADEKAAPSTARVVGANGGTNPRRALEEAEYIMNVSTKATKIVFIVTDGWWDNDKQSNGAIARMNDAGVLTVVVHIGSLKHYEEMMKNGSKEAADIIKSFQHGAKIMRSIDHPRALAPLAKHIVTNHIKERIYR